MRSGKCRKWLQGILAGMLSLAMVGTTMIHPVTTRAAQVESNVLTGKTSVEIVAMMGVGFNIGNSLDATGTAAVGSSQEITWGNPMITQDFMYALKERGFTTVRIPISWYKNLSSDGEYTIYEHFMDRVQEVVDYAYNAGLFVIINTMHEDFTEGDGLVKNMDENTAKLSAVWKQVSERFADYDQHLIFESMNEPRNGEIWTGNQETKGIINYMNQVFVNTVRCNGKGYNRERCLMVQGYAASGDANSLQGISLPTVNGEVCNNLIVSTHSYTPYNFCLQDSDNTFDEGDQKQIDRVFEGIKTYFLDYGIPVIMGETGCTNSNNNNDDRAAFTQYFAETSARYGVPVCIWDNGVNKTSGGECHSYIDRRKCEWYPEYKSIVDGFIDGFNNASRGSALTGRTQDNSGKSITYYYNGGYEISESNVSPSPIYKNMIFEGWYTTPDYKEGTELDPTTVTGSVNAYAKYSLNLEAFGLKANGAGVELPLPVIIGIGFAVVAVIAVVVISLVRKNKKKTK